MAECGCAPAESGDPCGTQAPFDAFRGHGLPAAAAGEQPPGAGVGGGGEVEPLASVAEGVKVVVRHRELEKLGQ